ncbi:hypothetical protein [Cupriavidus nantongensis]|nr:hypothetical protein [Cupriavidus nantongensis]
MLKFAALQGTGMTVLLDYLYGDEMRSGLLVPVLPGWAPLGMKVLAVFLRGLAWCRPCGGFWTS